MAEAVPLLFGQVWSHRSEHFHKGLDQLDQSFLVGATRCPVTQRLVDQLLHSGDGGIEGERFVVARHHLDRSVQRPDKLDLERALSIVAMTQRPDILGQPPDPLQPGRGDTADGLDALGRPVEVLLRRTREQHVESQRVGTVAVERLDGLHEIAPRLAHGLTAHRDHSLIEKVRERFRVLQHAHVHEHLLEEARRSGA